MTQTGNQYTVTNCNCVLYYMIIPNDTVIIVFYRLECNHVLISAISSNSIFFYSVH